MRLNCTSTFISQPSYKTNNLSQSILELKMFQINPYTKGSRASWLGKILTLFPDVFWDVLANTMPGLLARRVVFRLERDDA